MVTTAAALKAILTVFMFPDKHKVSETVVFSALGWKAIEAHAELGILEIANPKHCVGLRILFPQSLKTTEDRLLCYYLIPRREDTSAESSWSFNKPDTHWCVPK